MAFDVTFHGRPVTRGVMLAWSRASEPRFVDGFLLQLALQVCAQDLHAADSVADCIWNDAATDGNSPRAVLVVRGIVGWSMPQGHMLFDRTERWPVIWAGEYVGPAYFAVLPAAPV